MKRSGVLAVSTVPMERGNGVSSWILNMERRLDREDLRLDYALLNEPAPDVRAELEARGGRCFVLPKRHLHPVRYVCQLVRLLRREGYAALHVHGNSGTLAMDMLAAKLGGCKARIAHCHNTHGLYGRADRLLRPAFGCLYTRALACGEDAGKWLFGERPFEVLPVAVEAERYRFDPQVRVRVRARLGLEDARAICCIGGLIAQKNHAFLLRAFARARQEAPDLALVLAGVGELEAQLRAQAQALGLEASVRFLGLERDVPALLQGMDAVAMPSLFEGFPTVALEAQCAGLPLLLAEGITSACALTEFAQRLPLDVEAWANALAEIPALPREQSSAEGIRRVAEGGYDASVVAARLRQIYLEDGAP